MRKFSSTGNLAPMVSTWIEVFDAHGDATGEQTRSGVMRIAGRAESGVGRRFDLPVGRELILGRGTACDVVLLLEAVSRRHARLSYREDEVWAEDLGSRNGTILNGSLLTAPVQLRDGDELRIGSGLVRFRDEREPQVDELDGAGTAVGLDVTISSKGSGGDILSTMEVNPPTRGIASINRVVDGVDPQKALDAVLSINAQLGGRLELDQILPRMLEQLFDVFPQADCGIVLLDEARLGDETALRAEEVVDRLQVRAVRERAPESHGAVQVSRTILETAVARRQAVLSRDASSDFGLSLSVANLSIRSVMCVPLVGSDGSVLGALQVHTEDSAKAFGEDALRVLVSVSQAAAIAVENATLHGQLLQQERIQRDLELARRVQRSFLPSKPPEVDGYACASYYEPAYSVGGDMYTFLSTDQVLGFAVGDVSGKGTSAALLMARLTGDVRFSLFAESGPDQAMSAVDRSLQASHLDDRFVTMVLGSLDWRRHTLRVANAGHLPPLHWKARTGEVCAVGEDTVGLPLGVAEPGEGSWPICEVRLEPGDGVLFCTDGVEETRAPDGSLLGRAAVEEVLRAERGDAPAFARAIRRRMKIFSAGTRQRDDTTFFVVQRLPE